MIKEIPIQPCIGGKIKFVKVEAEPGEFLHQPVAVGGVACLCIRCIEHKVERAKHKITYHGMGKAVIFGE